MLAGVKIGEKEFREEMSLNSEKTSMLALRGVYT